MKIYLKKQWLKNSRKLDRANLFNWFVNNEPYWNGVYYPFCYDNLVYSITPIYKQINEYDFVLIDYEID